MWEIFDSYSAHGGWGFNRVDHQVCEPEIDENGFEIGEICRRKTPQEANQLKSNLEILKEEPFFDKNTDYSYLFTSATVPPFGSQKEKDWVALLADDFPALTYAVGHKGISVFESVDTNIDIRKKYLGEGTGISEPWLSSRKRNEWRHNDFFFVAYPVIWKLFDDWSDLIKGETLQ